MTGRMTLAQFNVCAKVLRSPPTPTQDAVRMVLVEGKSNSEAGEANPPTSPQSVWQATRRYEKIHRLILTAYGPVPQADLSK
jgi:hypothetical protein